MGSHEGLWTESPYKYTTDEAVALGSGQGFRAHQQWIESEARFAVTLFIAE